MCHVSCVICHMSCVMCHVSCVTCHMSLTPTATTAISPTSNAANCDLDPSNLGLRANFFLPYLSNWKTEIIPKRDMHWLGSGFEIGLNEN